MYLGLWLGWRCFQCPGRASKGEGYPAEHPQQPPAAVRTALATRGLTGGAAVAADALVRCVGVLVGPGRRRRRPCQPGGEGDAEALVQPQALDQVRAPQVALARLQESSWFMPGVKRAKTWKTRSGMAGVHPTEIVTQSPAGLSATTTSTLGSSHTPSSCRGRGKHDMSMAPPVLFSNGTPSNCSQM